MENIFDLIYIFINGISNLFDTLYEILTYEIPGVEITVLQVSVGVGLIALFLWGLAK